MTYFAYDMDGTLKDKVWVLYWPFYMFMKMPTLYQVYLCTSQWYEYSIDCFLAATLTLQAQVMKLLEVMKYVADVNFIL